MSAESTNLLGEMRPVGGGDPIPLRKNEMIIGRRPTSDIRLDFENVSGKHCVLRFMNGVWHVRDMGSTNGTTVNGQKIISETSLLPDDQLGVSSHFFTIDYEPAGPATSIMSTDHALLAGDEVLETRKHRSLLDLAGMGDETSDRPKKPVRPNKPPERIVRLSADEAEFEDVLPEHVRVEKKKEDLPSDDDFFKAIEDVVKPSDK